MVRIPALLLLALLAQQTAPALASASAKPEVVSLMQLAASKAKEGDIATAERTLRQAVDLDPTTTRAMTMLARLYALSARRDDSHLAWHHQATAWDLIRRAQKIDRDDSDLEDVHNLLSGKYDQPPRDPAPSIEEELAAGDRYAKEGKCDLAQPYYQKARKLDPSNADSLLAMGECQEKAGAMALAGEFYRQATELDPRQPGTWRALSFNLAMRKRYDESRAAALNAVAALPGARDNWVTLSALLRLIGKPLDTFIYKPMGSYSRSKDKTIVEKGMPAADFKAWLLFATSQAEEMDPKKPARSPFSVELAAWERALATIAGMPDAGQIKDETMRKMLAFHKAGQLKAALFLFAWRESYRPDFEAWRKANPDAMGRFIDTFSLSA